jgi:hypothetical protein
LIKRRAQLLIVLREAATQPKLAHQEIKVVSDQI